MTATLPELKTTWQARPGWGIAVDLTPREILVARHVRVHQRLVGLVLVLVLVLCVGLALLARQGRTSAQQDYDQEQSRTGQLAADTEQYSSITAMERVMLQVRTNLATVMGQDVDVAGLMEAISAALPDGVTVTTENLLLTPAPAPLPSPAPGSDPADPTAEGQATSVPGSTTPDPAAPQTIGSVTLAGTGASISSITSFVTSLNAVPGVSDVVPTSVSRGENGADYAISLDLTDELYTGRYGQAGPP